jgi:hypothetical protein
MSAQNFRPLGFIAEKLVHLLNRAIVGRHDEAVVVHVEDEVLAHDRQTDQCDISVWFHF